MIERTQQVWMERAANMHMRHRLLLHTTGTLLPASIPLEQVTSVLDVFCGPGAWAIDFARSYPHIQITAIDPDPQVVQMARRDAMLAGIKNLFFAVISPVQALPYKSEMFNLIHVQGSLLPLPSPQWPPLLQRLRQLLRTGGWLHLSDLELGPTSSPAFERFMSLIYQARFQAGCSTSKESNGLTSAVFYPRLLHETGYSNIHYTLTPIDLGNQPGSIGHNHPLSDLATSKWAGSNLVAAGLITQPELEHLFQRIHAETQQESYCALAMLISTIGTKPSL
jgi:trans-aconitate methyltransferase